MKTVEFTERAGSDKVLRLNIPVEDAGREYRVMVTVAPESPAEEERRGWPPGFIESTAGAWEGDSPASRDQTLSRPN